MTVPSPHQTTVNCLPTYIMIDTSFSMKDDEDTLNETIEYLYDELITSPRICEFAHVCIIGRCTGNARIPRISASSSSGTACGAGFSRRVFPGPEEDRPRPSGQATKGSRNARCRNVGLL